MQELPTGVGEATMRDSAEKICGIRRKQVSNKNLRNNNFNQAGEKEVACERQRADQNGKEHISQDERPRGGHQQGGKECPHGVSNFLGSTVHTGCTEHFMKCKIIH